MPDHKLNVAGMRPSIAHAEAYVPGESSEALMQRYGVKDVIKLNANENPFAPFPEALEAMQQELAELNRYPDSNFRDLKTAIGQHYGLSADHVALSHGAAGMLETLSHALLETGDEVIMPAQSYSLYRATSLVMGAEVKEVALRDYHIDLEAIHAHISPKTKLVWLCNPHNPCGTVFDRHQLEALLAALPAQAWLILDEAYAEFADAGLLPDSATLSQQAQLIAVRTFSKAYGLAGARLGYALAQPEVVRMLDTVSEPFNANRVALAAALVLLEHPPSYQQGLQAVRNERQRVSEQLRAAGFAVVASQSNFVFFDSGQDADQLRQGLLRQGIVLRSAAAWGFPRHLRMSIGTVADNNACLEALHSLMPMS